MTKVKIKIYKVLLMILGLVVMLPGISIALPPVQPPPGNPGPLGGSPDPLGVPFDWKMNLVLLLAGIVFAVIIIVKLNKNKSLQQTVK